MTTYTRGGYALPGSSLDFKTGSWRVQRPIHKHRDAPCHGACPAGEDAQSWLARIEEGHWQQAWESLVSVNPLPAITGRVCPHPCESACNRGQYDQPIAIHAAERMLGDLAIKEDWSYPCSAPKSDAPRMAIIGAGPAGLSCAWHLMRHGIQPVVFDQMPHPGGTLRTAIPSYRLPRGILDAEVHRLIDSGIDFRPHMRLGRDFSIEELQQEYSGIFLGPGLQQASAWQADHAVPSDLHNGLDLLKEWIAVGSTPECKSAAVLGGGNTAVDLCRVLKRSGVDEVHLITHYAVPADGVPADDRMGAIAREIDQALEEGVQIHEHRGVRRLILHGEKVTGVELVHMKKLTDADGKRRRVPFEGTETVLNVEQIFPAIGQAMDATGMEALQDGWGFKTDHNGLIQGQAGIYAGGDATAGNAIVSAAVGDGRRAALAMVAQLNNNAAPDAETFDILGYQSINTHYFEPSKRPEEPTLPVDMRQGCAEIDSGLSRVQVAQEAKRCFSCGTCFSCDNCWTLCPDSSVLKTPDDAPDGAGYVFDYDYCKGCGLCATECPCGFIEMEVEP